MMKIVSALIPIAASAALLAHPVLAEQSPARAEKKGDVSFLATPAGMTLYTYAKDGTHAKRSECDKQCAQAWPPFAVTKGESGAGDWKVISRDDGDPQWEYKGRPLYTFFKDTHPGEMKGQDYEGHSWEVAKP